MRRTRSGRSQREGAAGAALLPLGRDDEDLARLLERRAQRVEPGGEDPVVVGEENAHASTSRSRPDSGRIAQKETPGRAGGSSSNGKENWSGRLDLNQRPLAPHASALPGCATPRPESAEPDYRDAPRPFNGNSPRVTPSRAGRPPRARSARAAPPASLAQHRTRSSRMRPRSCTPVRREPGSRVSAADARARPAAAAAPRSRRGRAPAMV